MDFSDDDDGTSEAKTVQIKFNERRRIAEATFCDPSTFADQKGFCQHISLSVDMTALCKRRERRRPRTNRSQGQPSVGTVDDLIILPKSEPEEKRNIQLKCFFCLASVDLSLVLVAIGPMLFAASVLGSLHLRVEKG